MDNKPWGKPYVWTPRKSVNHRDPLGIGVHSKWADLLREIAQGQPVALACICGEHEDFTGCDSLDGALSFIRSHSDSYSDRLARITGAAGGAKHRIIVFRG